MSRFEADVTLTMKWHLVVEAEDAEAARAAATDEMANTRSTDPDFSDMQVVVQRGVL